VQIHTDVTLQYSCSGLPADDQERYLRASEVRRQVDEAPHKRVRVPAASGSSARAGLAKYPRTFKNKEDLPLQSKTPRQEYPVLASGSWDPTVRDSAGKARAIYGQNNRTAFDVVYHDPGISEDTAENFVIAPYRPARNAGGGSSSRDYDTRY
jgi:hypothetical protein